MCDGRHDEDEIQAAIDSGADIVKLKGLFYCDGPIEGKGVLIQ
jgi:hypothetical protein